MTIFNGRNFSERIIFEVVKLTQGLHLSVGYCARFGARNRTHKTKQITKNEKTSVLINFMLKKANKIGEFANHKKTAILKIAFIYAISAV